MWGVNKEIGMMRPDWCPESVWSSAGKVAFEDRETRQWAVARAILAERERCANIARNWPDRTAERIMDDDR